MAYPDNFNAEACDRFWGRPQTPAENVIEWLEEKRLELLALEIDNASEEPVAVLSDAFNDAIGQIKKELPA